MPRSKIPDFGEFLWPTIQALRDLGGSGTVKEIEDAVATIVHLTDEQRGIPHKTGSRTEIGYRMAWARTLLKAISVVENTSRAVWALTASGLRIGPAELEKIAVEKRRTYTRAATATVAKPEREPTEEWRDLLIGLIKKMDPTDFEHLCKRILREKGFDRVTVLGSSGDGGIDGVGILHVNLLTFRVYFQSKRWRHPVRPNTVRDFRGAMAGRGERGLIITTSHFTGDAEREASREGAPLVDLVDGDALCDLLKELGIGVRVENVERITVDPQTLVSPR